MRCIVSSLTDNESNELMDELLKGAPQPIDDRVESDDETESWETWQPDPVDANPGEERGGGGGEVGGAGSRDGQCVKGPIEAVFICNGTLKIDPVMKVECIT